MNISIDSKNGKTLLTQGKYCAENIVVTPVLEEKTVTPSTSSQSVTPSNGKAGLSKVTVGAIETEEKTVTSNGEVTPTSGKYLSKVTVNVPSTPTQEKSVTITENGTTEVTPDSGKALSKVTVTTNVPILDTSDATATASDIKSGKTAYAKGAKLTGTIATYDGTHEDIPTSTTWRFNSVISKGSGRDSWYVPIICNGMEYSFIGAVLSPSTPQRGYLLRYGDSRYVYNFNAPYVNSPSQGKWASDLYRTVTFKEKIPTGVGLLEWLQANAVRV